MVIRRITEAAFNLTSSSDKSSDSSEEDLEYLIDDILGKLSIHPSHSETMTIKNKNRKDRPKNERQERSSDVESTAYGFKPKDDRVSLPIRQSWSHTIPSAAPIQPESFAYSSYLPSQSPCLVQTNNYLQPNLKRHWSHTADDPNKSCDQITRSLNDAHTDSGDATGNNSEDEYYRISESSPTNPLKCEDNGLEQLLKEKKGWKIIHVRGDGACLFRSVSHQVFGDEEKHEIIRKQVVDYMVKNREHFSQYVTEDFDHYLQRKRQPACHGNHLEIQAISELYNRPVEIYYNSVVPINVFHAEYSHEIPIRLGYYDRTHYNSIIDPCKPSFGHGLGMPNYQPGLPEKDLVKQALNESESSQLEEAMFRDKIAESSNNDLENCIADHVLRESYCEHINKCYGVLNTKMASSTTAKQNKTHSNSTAPSFPLTNIPSGSKKFIEATASTSNRSQACSSSTEFIKSASSTSPMVSASNDIKASLNNGLSDSALLKYMPPAALDMDEEEVLAMVLEQSRKDYIENLSLLQKRQKSDDTIQPTAQSLLRKEMEPSSPNQPISPVLNNAQFPGSSNSLSLSDRNVVPSNDENPPAKFMQ